ncbi:MAG: DUF309 domain-containing protein [Chloroflexi bacterium]|nr:DUF309 domain-containing protein [Chloroflexota bacterium]
MTQPRIIVSGNPSWLDQLARAVASLDMALVAYDSLDSYGTRLTDDHAAAIVVDGQRSEWQRWTSIPKSSPATRRIPIALVSDDHKQREASRKYGADTALPIAQIESALAEWLSEHARVLNQDVQARLEDQCGEALPQRARDAIAMFNAGEYYQQHDLFEAQWMEEEGPVRDLYRAILQVGVAYYQIERGNRNGALKMLLRSVQWLNILPDRCQGVNVSRLRADVTRVREALEAFPSTADLADFDRSLLGAVEWSEDASA